MRIAVVAVLAGVLLAACTDSAPAYDAEDFRAGECRTVMPAAFAIDAAVQAGGDDSAGTAGKITPEQDTLRAALPGLTEAPVATATQSLVSKVGFYRIGVDAKNFTPKLASDLRAAYDALASVCATG